MVKGAAFGAVLAFAPRPLRRWMLTTLALGLGVLFTIEHAPYLDPFDPTKSAAEFAAARKAELAFFGLGYQFPWYCKLLIVAFVVWATYGYVRALRLTRRYYAAGQAPTQRLAQRVRTATNKRVLIAVDGTPRAPQGPTEASPAPVAPPPAPAPSPTVGSTLPKLWVPTYSGPAQPVQRVETSLGGTLIHDHRRVDPDGL